MALGPDRRFALRAATMTHGQAAAAGVDVGLREYMLRVYNYMTAALVLTGVVAYLTATTPAILSLLYARGPGGTVQATPLAWIAMFAPFAFILAMNFGLQRMKASTLQMVFWAFASVMGLSLANVFLVFTGASIARVFFITAATFAAMSLYGYTTKRDLSAFGSFLFMGLIGVVIASIVNLFVASSALQFAVSVIGVLVFVGLTAYDTQYLKSIYSERDDGEVGTKKAIMGATSLYLNFVNLFVLLLQLVGVKRE